MMLKFCIAVVLAAIAAGDRAEAAMLILGDFGNYGILVSGSSTSNQLQLTSDTFVIDTIGLGQIGATTNSVTLAGGGATIDGNIDFGANSNGLGTVTVTGNITTNVPTVGSAIVDAQNLASTYAALVNDPNTIDYGSTPPATIAPLQNGTIHVYDISEAWANTSGITINSGPNDPVVINITGNGNMGFVGNVMLTGGITADEVIFNVIGTGNLQTKTHSTTFNADILAPNAAINLDNFTINGRIYGSVNNGNFQFVSNAKLVAPPNNTGVIPEPDSFKLFVGGLGLVALGLTRKRRKTGA